MDALDERSNGYELGEGRNSSVTHTISKGSWHETYLSIDIVQI